MEKVNLDIMIRDKFYCTIAYEYNPLWPININELEKEIISRLPSLKNQPFRVYFPKEYGFKRRDIFEIIR